MICGWYEGEGGAVVFDCTSDNIRTATREIVAQHGNNADGVDIEAENSRGEDVSIKLANAITALLGN